MQARRVARELALLCLSQRSDKVAPQPLATAEAKELVLVAVRVLTAEAREELEAAAAELKQSHDRLLQSRFQSSSLQSAQEEVTAAIRLGQQAINRLGTAVDLPEMLFLLNQTEVQEFALLLLNTVSQYQAEINERLQGVVEPLRLERLGQLDLCILRLGIAELCYLDTPKPVAINEAVELSKRYGDEDTYRLVNALLRQVRHQVMAKST